MSGYEIQVASKQIKKNNYKKKNYSSYTKKKYSRYKKYIPRVPVNTANRIFSYKFRFMQNAFIQNGTASGAVPEDQAGNYSISIPDMPNFSSYARLYRQYRCCKLKFEFVPAVTNKAIEEVTAVPGDPVENVMPIFATSINRAGTTFPQNMDQMLSSPQARWTLAGRYHCRYFTPSTFDQVFRDIPALTNAKNPEYKQWLRTDDIPGPAHHGLDWCLSKAPGFGDGMIKYRIIITAFVQFKGLKIDTSL